MYIVDENRPANNGKRPLMLLRMFFSSCACADELAPLNFDGNMSTSGEKAAMQAPQTTNPSHQAPIHRGSRLSIPGSEYDTIQQTLHYNIQCKAVANHSTDTLTL